jgi:FkbM family methyltransferase
MMNIFKILKQYLRELFRALPKIRFLYILCQKYVDDYKGEHNSNMFTNGELRFLKRNIERFNTVFDVGARVGDWTKIALSFKKDLNIHCFEPSVFTYRKLISNNFPANVICNNFGLSSSKRKAKLFIFENGSGLNSLYRRYGLEDVNGLEPQKKEEIVELDTLDNYCLKNNIHTIDLVKIDVEGHEFEVLKGMRNLLKEKKVKMIQFEYGIVDARVFLKDIFDFFKDFDYRFYQIYHNKIQPIKAYNSELDNFRYKNFLIVLNNYDFTL